VEKPRVIAATKKINAIEEAAQRILHYAFAEKLLLGNDD